MHGRAAGLRTNMLVSLCSALFMLVSVAVAQAFAVSAGGGGGGLSSDPTGIAAQIITGISMACGAGLFELAIAVTLIGLFTLVVVNHLEKLYAKDSYRTLEIVVPYETDLSAVIDTVKREHLRILHLDYERDYAKNQMLVLFGIRLFHRGVPDKLSHRIIRDLESSGLPIQLIRCWH